MKTPIGLLFALLLPAAAFAQPRTDATLRVTVVDPSGAVIVGARVTVRPMEARQAGTRLEPDRGESAALETGARGDALFAALEPGRVAMHVESPGFEPADVRDVRVRAATTTAR